MKRIFTLAASFMLASFAFAQHGHGGYSPYGNDRYERDNNRPVKRFSAYERDAMIAHINMRYDERVYHVKHDWHLRKYEKRKIIRRLEFDRKAEIDAVYARFYGRRTKRMQDYANYDSYRH